MSIDKLFKEFCQYKLAIENYQESTIRGYQLTINLFLRVLPHIKNIEDVTVSDVEKFFMWGKIEKKWRPNTFLGNRKRLKLFFGWAVQKKFIRENPIDEIPKPRMEKKLPRSISKENAITVLEAARSMSYSNRFLSYRNHAIIAIILYAGLRRQEVCNLYFSDVDLENDMISIRQGKGSKDRVVPITERLHVILAQYIRERQHLRKSYPEFFISARQDKAITTDSLRRLHRKLQTFTKIKFTLHGLRHTFATMMIDGHKGEWLIIWKGDLSDFFDWFSCAYLWVEFQAQWWEWLSRSL